MKKTARILVGMPVYQGTDFIAETLRCVQQQDCQDFRVVISVDNNDFDTAEVCRAFLKDSRFSMVIQERHLGWAANINWLMAQGDYEFFCYWQHDDFASHGYLSALLKAADENPSAICFYSDIQWIGDDVRRDVCPSVTGFPINRALFFVESMNGIPFRGLIRKESIERTGPIRLTSFESSQEEFLWLATLAREGNLCRVKGPLYFKRRRKDSTSAKFDQRDRDWKRSVWLEYGLGALGIIWPLVSPNDRIVALGVVLERLCYPTNGRFMFYDPTPERTFFAAEFLQLAALRFEFPEIRQAFGHTLQTRVYSGCVAGDLLDQTLSHLAFVESLRTQAISAGVTKLDFRVRSPALNLLEGGWSAPEAWGVWSDGPVARIRVPVEGNGGSYRIRLQGQAFGDNSRTSVFVRINEQETFTEWILEAGKMSDCLLAIENHRPNIVLHFSFPDAVSPAELGISADTRQLSFGLTCIEISR